MSYVNDFWYWYWSAGSGRPSFAHIHQEQVSQPRHELNGSLSSCPSATDRAEQRYKGALSRDPLKHSSSTGNHCPGFLEGSFPQRLNSCPVGQPVLWGLFHRCREPTMSSPHSAFMVRAEAIPPQTIHTFVVYSYIISFSHYQKFPSTLCFMAVHIFFPTIFINNLNVFWCLAVNFFGLIYSPQCFCLCHMLLQVWHQFLTTSRQILGWLTFKTTKSKRSRRTISKDSHHFM